MKFTKKIRDDNERGARLAVLEDLFNDMNRSRFAVYRMNFVRGIFFGFGSVLGATVLIALFIWILNLTGALVPGLASFVNDVINIIKQK
jgi:hypothetical protein